MSARKSTKVEIGSRDCRNSTRTQFVCEVCGLSFFVIPARAKRGDTRFCSRACQNKFTTPLHERFMRYVGPKTESGCLEWTGFKSRGCGMITRGRKGSGSCLAHHVAWEIANGPIPNGFCVLRKCDNSICVNVDHLFLGTRSDGRIAYGESHHASKLSTEQVRSIRERYALGGISQYTLAREFGVTQALISYIILGKGRKKG